MEQFNGIIIAFFDRQKTRHNPIEEKFGLEHINCNFCFHIEKKGIHKFYTKMLPPVPGVFYGKVYYEVSKSKCRTKVLLSQFVLNIHQSFVLL